MSERVGFYVVGICMIVAGICAWLLVLVLAVAFVLRLLGWG